MAGSVLPVLVEAVARQFTVSCGQRAKQAHCSLLLLLRRGSKFTRLLTADGPDKLMDKLPTFLATPPRDVMRDGASSFHEVLCSTPPRARVQTTTCLTTRSHPSCSGFRCAGSPGRVGAHVLLLLRQAEHAKLPADQIVCIIDVDVVLLEDISYLAVNVKKGAPMGAKVAVRCAVGREVLSVWQGFMSFTGEDTPMDRMIK